VPSIRVERPNPVEGADVGSHESLPWSVGEETASLLKGVLGAMTGLVLLSWVLLAASHVNDRFDVGWTQGAWMGLARSARAGVLYPPLYDGSHYGGTRFMPLPILLLAQLARATGEYLISGKVFSYFSFALLLAVMVVVLRTLRCPTYFALGLAAAVLVSETGLFVASGIGADALPVALQVGAVAVIARSGAWRGTLAAALLCWLAFFTKESALWAPLAISLWLLAKDRRRLLGFLPAFLGLCAGTAALFQLVTHGRFFSNVVGLSFSGVSKTGSAIRPLLLFPILLAHAAPAVALIPLALVGFVLAAKHRELTIYHLSLGCAVVVLAVVLTDVGADFNHLLDLIVLAAIVAGSFASRFVGRDHPPSAIGATILMILSWALLTSFVATMFLPTGGVRDILNGRKSAVLARRPLSPYVQASDAILSEDPTIPIQLGQRPVVLDAFMLLRIGQKHPGWLQDLIGRIELRQFDTVILVRPLDPGHEQWYRTFHFGPQVFEALKENYRLLVEAENYFVYVPMAG
jgi:hypothetical protein